MGKKPKEVYIYNDGEFIRHTKTINEAAYATGHSNSLIRLQLLDQPKCSRKGFVFTTTPLSEEEMKHMPKVEVKEEKKEERFNNICKVQLSSNQEFETNCADHRVFYIERSKESRKAQLREYVFTKLSPYWLTLPQKMANLHRRFVSEIIDSF